MGHAQRAAGPPVCTPQGGGVGFDTPAHLPGCQAASCPQLAGGGGGGGGCGFRVRVRVVGGLGGCQSFVWVGVDDLLDSLYVISISITVLQLFSCTFHTLFSTFYILLLLFC